MNNKSKKNVVLGFLEQWIFRSLIGISQLKKVLIKFVNVHNQHSDVQNIDN